ncbi:hypothetical protein [Naasia sp. SYSU D00948]|uniref:hypothetical protein n=1 Tax=Naasia sp. SYSU D00948 TaxID=2817379 RepID=UPI0027DE1D42|nr:hypothetical protein [Naasia sp. SYSU D00948]
MGSTLQGAAEAGPEGPIALSILLASLAATPTPPPEFDENLVTPGPWGFIIILFIAVVTILLILDMTRRVRRTRYRAEVRERLEREQAPEQAQEQDDPPKGA